MAYSVDTTVGELLDNAGSCGILEKHIPGMTTDPQMSMARGMSLTMIANFFLGGRITKEILAAINEDLKTI